MMSRIRHVTVSLEQRTSSGCTSQVPRRKPVLMNLTAMLFCYCMCERNCASCPILLLVCDVNHGVHQTPNTLTAHFPIALGFPSSLQPRPVKKTKAPIFGYKIMRLPLRFERHPMVYTLPPFLWQKDSL